MEILRLCDLQVRFLPLIPLYVLTQCSETTDWHILVFISRLICFAFLGWEMEPQYVARLASQHLDYGYVLPFLAHTLIFGALVAKNKHVSEL